MKENAQIENRPTKRESKCSKEIKPRIMYGIEDENVINGAIDAKIIFDEFNKLSEFKLKPIGTSPFKFINDKNFTPTSKHLDFEIQYKGERIAELDVTGCNYTLEGSAIMPVRCYKGKKIRELGLPTFILFWMKLETGDVKDCSYWIKGEDVIKSPTGIVNTKPKNQDNYLTNKNDWKKGLTTLIEELQRLIYR
jgi:hypothetical protein